MLKYLFWLLNQFYPFLVIRIRVTADRNFSFLHICKKLLFVFFSVPSIKNLSLVALFTTCGSGFFFYNSKKFNEAHFINEVDKDMSAINQTENLSPFPHVGIFVNYWRNTMAFRSMEFMWKGKKKMRKEKLEKVEIKTSCMSRQPCGKK